MKEDLVSIVITTYKRAERLKNAIESALNQTYKNIEVIVVDDNEVESKERQETQVLMKKYKDRVIYIQNKKNLGGGLSRNVGIDNSSGKYIAFLDDDDSFEPTKIEKQYKCYLEHIQDNPGLIYCYTYRQNKNNEIIGAYKNDYEGNPLYKEMLNCIAATSLWFCPKEVLEKVGKFEDTPSQQDALTLMKILANDYNIYRVPECLATYYEHGGEGISGMRPRNIKGLKNYQLWCRKYYNKLEDNKQIKDIEYNFSKEFVTKYVFNNMKKEAYKELRNMIKLKPFNLKTYKAIIKVLFPKFYRRMINK